MAKSLNQVQLIGNIGKEPELKYTPSGSAVAKLSIATNERYKDKAGEWQEKTEWHNIVLWQHLAEFVGKYLSKGSRVYVSGRLQTRSWDDKQTGQKKYMTEIVANEVIPCSEAQAGYAEGEQRRDERQAPGPPPAATGPITDDDIPF